MKSRLFIVSLLLTAVLTNVASQNQNLADQSFEELFNLFNNAYDNDLDSLAHLYADAYIEKAKQNKIIFNVADGYLFKSYLSNYKDAIHYSDSIIELTKSEKHNLYPAVGHMIKGYYLYNNGLDKEALDQYLIANKYAKQNNNEEQQIDILQFIGSMKYNSGNYVEAIPIFEKQLKFLERQPSLEIDFQEDYLITLDNISKSYLRGNNPDSAFFYVNKGISLSLRYKDMEMYYRFLLNSGEAYYKLDNYKRALDSLNKVESKLSSVSLAICLYYKAKIYEKEHLDKAIPELKKIDSIYQKTQNPFLELRDVYKTLFDFYTQKDNYEEQLINVQKLIKVDSLLDINFKYLENSVAKDYEIPKLKQEKEKLESQLQKKDRINSIIIFIALVSIIASVFFVLRFYSIQKSYKKRYLSIIHESSAKKELPNRESKNRELNIPLNVIDQILDRLIVFEQEKEFTENGLTLAKLSRKMDTNSSYLSKIINHHRSKSFAQYLNGLRIEHAVDELKNNTQLRNFTINAIANEVGFNNAESFSKAFYKRTGLKPSFFIKKLKDSKL